MNGGTATAVVFGYSEVGARCLEALYAAGVAVSLVVTHADDPGELRWFASVAAVAAGRSRVLTPADPAEPALATELAALAPDFIFSFYYRRLLPQALLALARRGALNMHGSLLPKYRGRAPVNWAVLMGEHETGASLHYMVAKPDAGALVDQQPVPIGPDDTALIVANRVADAAVVVLTRALPRLIAGTAAATPLDLTQGSYFGARRPEDGRFEWEWPAARIHNLVRAVAPPFPGAYADLAGRRLKVNATRRLPGRAASPGQRPRVYVAEQAVIADCADGARLELAELELAGAPLDAARFVSVFGHDPVPACPPARAPARATLP